VLIVGQAGWDLQLAWTLTTGKVLFLPRVKPRLFERSGRNVVNIPPELSRLQACAAISDVTYAVAFLSSAPTADGVGWGSYQVYYIL
jgi:hypothetical protein